MGATTRSDRLVLKQSMAALSGRGWLRARDGVHDLGGLPRISNLRQQRTSGSIVVCSLRGGGFFPSRRASRSTVITFGR